MNVIKADGTVLIDTRMHTEGFNKGTGEVKSQFAAMASKASEAAKQIETSMNVGFSKSVEMARARLQSLEIQFATVSDLLKEAVYLDDDRNAERLGAKQERLYDQMADARRRLEIEVADAARRQADEEEKAAERTRREAEKSARAAEAAARRQVTAEERAAKNQARYTAAISDSTKSTDKLGKATGRFGTRLSSIVSGALFFNVISSGLSSLTRTLWGAISSTNEMKTALNNLKGAASVAAAPLVNALSKAFAVLTNAIADAFGWLSNFYSLLTGKSISSMKQQAQQMNSMASSATKAQKALAGFDEITVLQDKSSGSGGGSSSPNYNYGLTSKESYESAAKAVEKFRKVLEPLQKIDYSKLTKSTENLEEANKNLSDTINKALADAYNNVLVPLATWFIEDFAPTSVDTLTEAFDFLEAIVSATDSALTAFHEHTKPIWEYLGGIATDFVDGLGGAFSRFAATVNEKNPEITKAFDDLGWVIGEAYRICEPLLNDLRDLFKLNMETIASVIDSELGKGIDSFTNLAAFIRQVFSGDFSGALGTIKKALDDWIIGSIETLNVLLMSFGVGLNKLLVKLNAIQFTIPDWIPGIGGKTFDLNVKPINVANLQIPIPELASGAVIPPNAPFLAMLGDQRHGTNIEAPLATIQEAFRQEVSDMVGGMMAGFQASVAVQEQILAAVMSIEIGDTTIGEAAARYNVAERIVRGG